MSYFIDDLLLECLPPLDLLLTLDSDFFSALPGVEFFLDEARDPAFNLPTVRDTLPIKVCKKVKIKTKWPNRKGSFKFSPIKNSSLIPRTIHENFAIILGLIEELNLTSAEFNGIELHFFNPQWIISNNLIYFGNHMLDLLLWPLAWPTLSTAAAYSWVAFLMSSLLTARIWSPCISRPSASAVPPFT